MLWVAFLIAVAACGRVGFDPRADGEGPAGHDEDGDGVVDALDVCPHDPGTQSDGDGDRVGDDCDPNPTVARDTIARFITMMPGDAPLEVTQNDGMWTQLEDSWQFTGVAQPDDYLSTDVELAVVVGDVRVAVGFDVVSRIEPANQHQLALIVADAPPYQFVEVNDVVTASISRAQISQFDGTQYTSLGSQQLATGVHTGAFVLQATQRVGVGVELDAAWGAERYRLMAMSSLYQGATTILLDMRNLQLELRFICVITSS